MVVEKGYKLTEVGVIPEDWDCEELKKYFSFISYGFTNPMPTSLSGVYMITANDIKHGKIQFDKARKTTEFAYKNKLTEKSRPRKNDVLLTKDGSLGRLAIVGDEIICINQSVAIIRPNDKVYPNFLKLLLEGEYYQKTMIDNAGGSTIKHIYITIIDKMLVALPAKLHEQTAIANALSDMDALIAQTEKLIEKKKAIKQGVMQELLKPKEGWVTKKIPEICWFQEGPGVRKHQFTQNGVKLLNGTNIQFGKLELDNTDKYISENEAYGWYSHFLVDDMDILIACSGVSIDKFHEKVTVAQKHNLPLCMNTSTMRFKINFKYLNADYFAQFLKSNYFKAQISGKATGSAQLNFGPSHINMIEVPLPSIQKQIEIGKTLVDLENDIVTIETKLQKLKNQKQGMMQALLTGKIRLV
jgi:type I restriction enzyme S subunit